MLFAGHKKKVCWCVRKVKPTTSYSDTPNLQSTAFSVNILLQSRCSLYVREKKKKKPLTLDDARVIARSKTE